MDKTLEQLLGSKSRIRVLRLFFHQPEEFFSLKKISQKTKVKPHLLRKELTTLKQIGFLKTKYMKIGKNRKRELLGGNKEFSLWKELQGLVLASSHDLVSEIASDIKKLGAVKLAVLGGTFINQHNARADMLIVVPRLSQRKLNHFIGNIEAESGTDINCVVITPAEFIYRYNLCDRVVRDMLSPKNVRLINKLDY